MIEFVINFQLVLVSSTKFEKIIVEINS